MHEMDLCRLCANLANNLNSQKLFVHSQRKLLKQIEELIGVQLKNSNYLPQLICETCHEQTLQAYQFRELCIRVQEHFETEEEEYAEENKMIQEQVALTEINIVVERQEEPTKEDQDENQAEECDMIEVISHCNDEEVEDTLIQYNTEVLIDEYRDEPSNNDDLEFLSEGDYYLKDDGTKENEESLQSTQQTDIDLVAVENTEDQELRPLKTKQNRKQKKFDIICEQCGRHFKDRGNFEVHKRRHSGIKRFHCNYCSKKFFAKPDLQSHIRSHTGEKPFPCRYCEQRYKDISSRTRHERVHAPVRAYACDKCDKSFTNGTYLKRHRLIHTGERPFDCVFCNASFQTKKHLKQHCLSFVHKANEAKHNNQIDDIARDNKTKE